MLKINYQLKKEHNKDFEKVRGNKPLGFGVLRTDHMFMMNYSNSKWYDPRIIPYQDIKVAPGAIGLNYSQTIFEGIKAFKHKDGKKYLFRADEHVNRFNHSAEIMCTPSIPVNDQLQAIKSLIKVEEAWFPEQSGASIYVRPLLFSNEDCLGVRPGNSFIYCIFLSPSGEYYSQGLNGISLLTTKKFQRVLSWGIGTAKTGVNYGSSLYILQKAKSLGAQQVLFLDKNGEYLEEAGTMNHFYVNNKNEIIIPKFNSSILRSITSLSFLDLTKKLGYKIRQKNILFADFIKDLKNGYITEAGGLGTAAVVTPVVEYILDNGKKIKVGNGQVGPVAKKMYSLFTGIQSGEIKSPKGWLLKV
ncbi:MAG TPA: branched-chain amino acid aminotransferase [Candidatus Magasanikbacteria bacterium]|nr:branched-chain amino acid aminotransferase [Candidatus Magasanikbacteria bacterium]